jgi:hypothetical protein
VAQRKTGLYKKIAYGIDPGKAEKQSKQLEKNSTSAEKAI